MSNDLKWSGPARPSAPTKSARRPKRFSTFELKRVGVAVLDESNVQLQCIACHQVWSPNILSGGKLHRGYWKCPNGCNSPKGKF